MREHGQQYTCDRCGRTGFFQNEPSSWGYDIGMGDLCPSCAKSWKEVKNQFKHSTSKFW